MGTRLGKSLNTEKRGRLPPVRLAQLDVINSAPDCARAGTMYDREHSIKTSRGGRRRNNLHQRGLINSLERVQKFALKVGTIN